MCPLDPRSVPWTPTLSSFSQDMWPLYAGLGSMKLIRGGTGNLYSSLTVVTFLNQNLVERDDWICWLLRRISLESLWLEYIRVAKGP